jgi:membrane protease YdiL (CAAX protease family)
MRAAGVFRVESVGLHGAAALKYAILWGVVFVAVAFFEEFGFRGYVVFTLSTGVGFWPAAMASSLAFGYVHHGNEGETWLGAFNAGLVGLLFCLMLRRTGDLWLPIGFHAAWDWGESYFYGVPDSGTLVAGHFMNVSFTGPQWLTGGTVGPEGSWLCTLLLVVLGLAFHAWLREAGYPIAAAGPRAPNGITRPPESRQEG